VATYAIGAWVLLQVGDVLIGLLELPGWIGKAMVAIALAGLPVAMVLAWIYDWTPKGIVATRKDPVSERRTFAYADPSRIDVGALNLARPRLSELVGRRAERTSLAECLASAREGVGGVVLISGEPGVGKSRLGEEALTIGSEMGMLPLTGHAYEERGAPLITSIEILEEVLHILPEDALRNSLGNTAPEIARLLPELRRVFPDIPEPDELPPEQQQRFLFNAVFGFLKRLGEGCPVVILLDDMHWADESSIQLLEHLAQHVRRIPVLMVATYRDVEADMGEPFKRALAELLRQPYVTRIALRRFSRDDVDSLLRAFSGHKPPTDVIDTIFDETNGNAFYVQSVYEHLADEGRLFDKTGEWRTNIDPASLDVPDSVRLVTGRRIARLSEQTQDLLRIAAVMGLRFRIPILEAACDDPDTAIDCVEEAESAHLIKRSTGGRELRYEFVHALARQTVLSDISPARQQKLHAKIASAIEQVYAATLEAHAADLAFHLAEAGAYVDREKVINWLKVAGKNAFASVAMEEAVGYFDQALAIAGDAEPELRADLLYRRVSAQLGLGNHDTVQADMDEAFSLYQDLGLVDKAAQIASELAYVLIWIAQPARAQELVRRGLDLAPDQISVARCNLLSARGLAHSMGGEPDDPVAGKELHLSAVTMARQLSDSRLLADMLHNQALDYWVRLDPSASTVAHEAAAILRRANQGWKLGQCLWMEKAGLVFSGKFDEAARIDDELLPLAKQNGDFGALGCSWLLASTIEQACGNLAASSEALRVSTEAFDAGGFPWGKFNAGYHAVNLLLAGQYGEARDAVDAVGANPLEGTVWTGAQHGYWLSGKAQLGDTDVLEQFHKYESNLPEQHKEMAAGAVIFLKGSIEALVISGANEDAGRLYPLIAEFLEQVPGKYEFAFGVYDRFAGMAAAAAEDWGNAERHYRDALELADKLPHRIDQARVRYWYARMLQERGMPADNRRRNDFIAKARELSMEMGMHGLIERIDNLASH